MTRGCGTGSTGRSAMRRPLGPHRYAIGLCSRSRRRPVRSGRAAPAGYCRTRAPNGMAPPGSQLEVTVRPHARGARALSTLPLSVVLFGGAGADGVMSWDRHVGWDADESTRSHDPVLARLRPRPASRRLLGGRPSSAAPLSPSWAWNGSTSTALNDVGLFHVHARASCSPAEPILSRGLRPAETPVGRAWAFNGVDWTERQHGPVPASECDELRPYAKASGGVRGSRRSGG